jgi:hypothetical protein
MKKGAEQPGVQEMIEQMQEGASVDRSNFKPGV